MIKPESNAPSPMKPWVRTTDKQIEDLESAVARVESVLGVASGNIDYELNQGLTNTFSFTPIDDGSTQTSSGAMNFTGAITSENDISLAGTLIVGDPSRQQYDDTTGEPIGQIPTLEVVAGKVEINPVTEAEYYTTGQLNITDTSFNVDSYGLIHGDGLQITLANDGQVERQNIAILGATGNGTNETFQIANNANNVLVYTAGKYVNISGVDPAGYNGDNLLIVSVNTGVSPMTFTVAGETSASYIAGGYVTINKANSIYEGKLSVQGPSPYYTGVTVDQNGVHVGINGGDPVASDVTLDSTGLTAPNAFIDQAIINGTRFFISDTPPTAVNDGDIWLDKTGVFSAGTVTSTSVVSANGFSGTVANSSTTPAITLSTTITGLLKGNGTAISAATSGTDYVLPSGSITGSAGSVSNSLFIRADSGTTEGTDLYTFNGSASKTIDIKGGTNITIAKAAGSLTINSASYTLPKATATTLGGIELFNATVQTVAANAVTTEANRTYGAQLNSADQLVINVPWTDTIYTLPKATASALGGVELFSATVQSVAANAVSTTAGKTYGVQMNSVDQLVVNVPWTDTLGYIGSFQTTAASSSLAVSLTPASVTTSPAAAISLVGGATTLPTGVGGGVNVTGGAASTGTNTATGGSVTIRGGASNTSNGIGGSVSINGGQGSSANGNGYIQIGTTTTDGVTIGASLSLTNGISGALNLNNASSPLQVQGSAGAPGTVLTSAGAGNTPTWNTIPASTIKIAANCSTTAAGTALAVNTQGTATTVTFPVGRFTTNVTPSIVASTSSPRYVVAITSALYTGFTMIVRNVSDATGTTYTWNWQAIEPI